MQTEDNVGSRYCQTSVSNWKTDYLRHPFIAKGILRGVGSVMIPACRVMRPMPTFYTVNCPGANTKARKNNQANRQSLHVAWTIANLQLDAYFRSENGHRRDKDVTRVSGFLIFSLSFSLNYATLPFTETVIGYAYRICSRPNGAGAFVCSFLTTHFYSYLITD